MKNEVDSVHENGDGIPLDEGSNGDSVSLVKVVVVSLVFVVIAAWFVVQGHLYKSMPAIDTSITPSHVGLFAVFVLMFVNYLGKLVLNGRILFKKGEMILVYCLLMFTSAIMGADGIMRVVPRMIVPAYVKLVDAAKYGIFSRRVSELLLPKV